MDRANPRQAMSLSVSPSTLRPGAPASPPHSFVVGQDSQGRWVAVEIHGLGGGLFRSRRDAVHYAAGETPCRPEAVPLSPERIEFQP